jgi:hypothetical protein
MIKASEISKLRQAQKDAHRKMSMTNKKSSVASEVPIIDTSILEYYRRLKDQL